MSFSLLAAAVYLGGVLTIVSPCILPVLPFVFASANRPFIRWTGPMLCGLVAAFVGVAVAGTAGAAWVANAADVGRWVALAVLAIAGLMLLSTRAATIITRPLVRFGAHLERRAGGLAGARAQDSTGGEPLQALALGAATGLLWAPCAGPLLGLVVALGASGAAPARTASLLALFGLGAATALAVVLAGGGRALKALRRVGIADRWIHRGIGATTLVMVAVIALGWDATLLSGGGLVQTAGAEEAILRRLAPDAKAEVRRALDARASVDMPDFGPLPDFAGGAGWLNGDAIGNPASGGTLTAGALRGKVVVVNVWTFECYNCLNALPHIKALAAKYRGQDVVVIGVHTPELARERVPENVAAAVRRLGVTYPVVLDPGYAIWRAFHNEYWPSVYIADKAGRMRFRHFGEGAYDEEDGVVAQLLSERPGKSP
ncbi:MAG: redoxin domain-containing protein [Gemmatimonadota bacterium]|nr:redoxin domain-containing protein [Gemmatimonadota bacterium]